MDAVGDEWAWDLGLTGLALEALWSPVSTQIAHWPHAQQGARPGAWRDGAGAVSGL